MKRLEELSREEMVDLLLNKKEEWNRRKVHGFATSMKLDINFDNNDLTGLHLSNVNFEGASFRNANLCGADLGNANLMDTDLSSAQFRGAGLQSTNFEGAKMWDTVMIDANLEHAKLTRADASGADLAGADLTLADLSESVFAGVNFQMANFCDATLEETDLKDAVFNLNLFCRTQFLSARNLGLCQFQGPCALDEQTILLSEGLPKEFLQGCGLSDPLIDFYESHPVKQDPLAQCFISFSSEDMAFAEKLYKDLQAQGIRAWLAPDEVCRGLEAIDEFQLAGPHFPPILLVLSERSMASEWIQNEVIDGGMYDLLKPISLVSRQQIRNWRSVFEDSEDIAETVRECTIFDFSRWRHHDSYQKAFDDLIQVLRAEASSESE